MTCKSGYRQKSSFIRLIAIKFSLNNIFSNNLRGKPIIHKYYQGNSHHLFCISKRQEIIGVYRGGAKRPWPPPPITKKGGAKGSDGPPHGMK